MEWGDSKDDVSEIKPKVSMKMKHRGLNPHLFQSPDLEILSDVSYCWQCSVCICI